VSGVERIAAERQRQIEQEGWTPEHDDQHASLPDCCGSFEQSCVRRSCGHIGVAMYWPVGRFGSAWWKPEQNPIDNLVKAGALIAAEIDRLERAGGKSKR
jgi:hypothetical protein